VTFFTFSLFASLATQILSFHSLPFPLSVALLRFHSLPFPIPHNRESRLLMSCARVETDGCCIDD
jgi:hypothetical protein